MKQTSTKRKKRIAMIFPYAPSYRQAIYELMDQEFDIDWYFAGNARRNLRFYDYSRLNRCDLHLEENTILNPIHHYRHNSDLNLRQYDYVMLPGVIRNLSDWANMIKIRLMGKHRPKIWLWTHGWYGRESSIQKYIKRLFFSLSDGIAVYGDHARKLMVRNGIGKDKIRVISNSLDFDTQLAIRQHIRKSYIYEKIFGNKLPVLIYLGRLTAYKELDRLVTAVRLLSDRGMSCNLMMVGDGEARKELEDLARTIGIKDKIYFAGECFDEQINAEYLYNADICVSPGNVGLTAIHSLMFGTPVITHDTFIYQGPEFEAIKPEKTGDFFHFKDTGDLVATIERWFSKHSDREEIRRECYSEVDSRWNPHAQMEVIRTIFR